MYAGAFVGRLGIGNFAKYQTEFDKEVFVSPPNVTMIPSLITPVSLYIKVETWANRPIFMSNDFPM